MQRQGPPPVSGQPVNAYVCTIGVDDLDAALARTSHAGGRQVVDRMPIPGVGWLAYVNDPDGNIVGLMQHDASAA